MSNPTPAPAPKAPVPAPAPAPAPARATGTTQPATAAAPATKKTSTTKKKTVKKASGAGTTAKPKKKATRKRPPSSSRGTPSATSAQNIWNAAAVAQKELAQQSAQAAALRSDPLWYHTDDPVASIDKDSFMVTGGKQVLPDQVELVEAALANNNMTRADVTPQAFACLLEQGRRYALELLADAQDYAYSANRHDVTRADLILAQELRADQPLADFTQQPKLFKLAQQVNRTPLPPIPTNCYSGVVLPPKEYQLTARTFDVISGAQVAQRMVAPPPAAPVNDKTTATTTTTTTTSQTTSKPSYGASRGRQIPIHIAPSTKHASTTAAPITAGNGQPAAPATTTTGSTAPPVATTTTTAGAVPGDAAATK